MNLLNYFTNGAPYVATYPSYSVLLFRDPYYIQLTIRFTQYQIQGSVHRSMTRLDITSLLQLVLTSLGSIFFFLSFLFISRSKHLPRQHLQSLHCPHQSHGWSRVVFQQPGRFTTSSCCRRHSNNLDSFSKHPAVL